MRRPLAIAVGLALPACLIALAAIGCAASAGSGVGGGVSANETCMVNATAPVSAADEIETCMASADSPAGTDHHLTVSASCRSGGQMLAGGYTAVDVFESDYSLLSTYPSAQNTWTVSTDSGSSYGLQTFVYCLSSTSSLGIQRLQANACPVGTVRLSAGFQGVSSSKGIASTPYVLCASHGITATASGFRMGDTELDCADQATGDDRSESRSFSYTCTVAQAAS